MINKITKLSNQRYELLDREERSSEEELLIDKYADEIYSLLKAERNNLPFEFIIEELTKLGGAPCLVYDDNGMFAITGDGFHEVASDEPKDMVINSIVAKEQWKPTIREALNFYLDNDE